MRKFPFLMVSLSLLLAAPAVAQAPTIASMTEAQIKPILVGNWTIEMGFGTGPLTIKDVQNGQLTVSGYLPLNLSRLIIKHGQITSDKIVLLFSEGTMEGRLTTPIHMEGDIHFRGDETGSTARWRADRRAP
jgi:hypothetical protein